MNRGPFVQIGVRALPPALVLTAAALFIARVEGGGVYLARNLAPLLAAQLLWVLALVRNHGRWIADDRRWTLAAFGFAIPAVGLSVYLHAQWFYDIDGIATRARTPDLLFAYLPYYTVVAGGIGFAIGWIVGKNVSPELRR